MPVESLVILSAIVAVFVIFGSVLAYANTTAGPR